MVSSTEIQQHYIDLYSELREYIWSFETVKCIADLELACFAAIPSLSVISQCITQLANQIRFTSVCDELITSALDEFEKLIQSDVSNSVYATLYQVKEVVQ